MIKSGVFFKVLEEHGEVHWHLLKASSTVRGVPLYFKKQRGDV